MSTYRFLQDHYVNGATYLAGTTASTLDAGGSLPIGWTPTGAVDPLDTPAVNAFYAAGPQVCGSIKTQWSGLSVAAPVTRWVAAGPNREYVLNGLGTGMPMKQLFAGGIQP
jgi:hypothetical protein